MQTQAAIQNQTQSSNNVPANTQSGASTPVAAPNNTNTTNLLGDTNTKPAEWYLSEGVPGTGPKPDFYKEGKYKSLADQAKAYTELEKKLGSFTGAPEKYEIKMPEEMKDVQFDTQDPLFKDFEQYARDSNMSQNGFNDLLAIYARYERYIEQRESEEEKKYVAEEINKLGGEKWFQERDQLKEWIQNRVPPEFQEVAKEIGNSATAINFLKWMRSQVVFPTVPNATGTNHSLPSPSDLRKAMADKRYNFDPAYRKEVDDKYKLVYGG